MSIYATLWTIKIETEFDKWHEVYAQAVPGWINYIGKEWEWLPPELYPSNTPSSVMENSENFIRFRAVYICDDLTTKGTERNGQEYVNPLLVLTGEEYEKILWKDLLDKINEKIQTRIIVEHE
jgi:hypothetical protein